MKGLIFAVMMVLSGVASANCGNGNAEPSNGCNGEGGSVFSDIRNTNTNANLNNNVNNNTARGGTGVGVGVGIGVGGEQQQSQTSISAASGSAYNGGNSVVIEGEKQVRQAPSAMAPAAFSTANCRVGFSGGLSTPVGGLSFGGSDVDETCELIELSKQLRSLGLREQAVQIMCLNPKAKKVMGPLCIAE